MRVLKLLVVVVFAIATSVEAQTPPPQGQTQRQPPAGRGQRGAGQRQALTPPPPTTNPLQAQLEVQEMFDALVLAQSERQLQLTSQQFPLFFQRMKQLQNLRRGHQRERGRLLGHLRRLVGPQAPEDTDDATFSAQTKLLDDLEARMAQDELRATAFLDEILTPRQRARFRVFEDNMERQKLLMLSKVLQAGPAGAPAPGNPAIIKR